MRQVYASKEDLQKRNLAQNCFNLTIQNEITTKLFLYKKRQKIYLPYEKHSGPGGRQKRPKVNFGILKL